MPEIKMEAMTNETIMKVIEETSKLGKSMGYGDAQEWAAVLSIASQVFADTLGVKMVKLETGGACGKPGCKNCGPYGDRFDD